MTKRTWRKKDVLRRSLLGLAHNLGPGQRLPTISTLCESLSVSNSTLDPILRDLEKQGAIVREHGRGIFVSSNIHRKTIGVVFGGDIFAPGFSPLWSILLGAVRGQAGEHRFQPRAYFDIDDGHAQLLEDLEGHRLDGLLLLAPQSHYDEVAELCSFGLPLVVFGDNASVDWSVTFDWDRFFELVLAELAGTDCRRIGLIALPEQRRGFERALCQAGLADLRIDDWSYETWATIIPGAGTRENCAFQLTRRIIAATAGMPLPDVLVSLEDTATRGVVTALREAGLHPGRDVHIVTAENRGSPVLEPFAEDLTRIAFDPVECVAAMLAMLETLLADGTPAHNPARIAPSPAPPGRGMCANNGAPQ